MLFAFIYHTTLVINSGNADFSGFNWIRKQILLESIISYLIMMVFTYPIWWLVFRRMKKVRLNWRLASHIILLPLFVIICQQVQYFIKESLDLFHLYGVASVWDIYIPGLLYLLQFGIFHAYEHYTESREKERRAAALREAALKSELAAIKAQLNPHFLYNVFNTISATVPPELEHTRELIAKLSDLFRYQLRASKTELVSLREELDFVQKYLELEKARFKERLSVHIEVPEALMEKEIPPMILQPLVENSIKHGLSSLIEGGEVSLIVTEKDGRIHFEVADTGVGVRSTENLIGNGIGLTNTQLRLEKGFNSGLSFKRNYPRGLKVAFSI
ncbi:MAG: histidine kinase [Bacteroidia bacterium]|nr:histidine kinase [Bacteroidia bacterium]